MPDEAEPGGLLALMLLHDARRTTRTDETGVLVPLDRQDRTRWAGPQIAEGVELLDRVMRRRPVGPYRLQAAIAACHAVAPTAAETDWPQIVLLYEHLLRLLPSPVVELNRAVAVGMAVGPQAGLDLLTALEAAGQLGDYHLVPATRADLLRRLGRTDAAAESYRSALESAGTDAERRYLADRLAEISGDGVQPEQTRSSVGRPTIDPDLLESP